MSITAFNRRRREIAAKESAQAKEEEKPEAKGIPSKTDIARMPKAELAEWIEAHGVDSPDGTVAELREKLTRMIYTDL